MRRIRSSQHDAVPELQHGQPGGRKSSVSGVAAAWPPACPSFGAAYHTGDAFCAEWGRALRDAPAPVPAALERAEAADARREPDVVAAGA